MSTAVSETTEISAVPSLRPLIVPVSGLLLALFGAGLSGTVVATSIPTIMADLEGPSVHAAWLVAATILANCATTPIWGKLGDRFNPKRVLLCAIAFFVVGTLLPIFAINTTMLIFARVIQGIGFGGIFVGVAIAVAGMVGARQRGRINGWMSITMTTAQLTAPVLGGVLATAPILGWRWSFVAIFPIALAALIIIALTLKLESRTPSVHRTDYAGALLIGATVTSLLLCVTTLGDTGITDPLAMVTGPLAVVLLIITIIVEMRAADPIIPLALLARRTPLLVVIGALCAGTTMFTGTVFTSEYLQLGLGFSPAISGAMLIPMALGTAISAYLAGRYMSATGRIKSVLVLGFSSLVAGSLVLTAIGLAPIVCAVAGTILVASGLGLVMQNQILAAQNSVDHEHVGTISATVMFFMTLGGAIGLVCSGSLLNSLTHSAEAAGASTSEAYLTSIPWIFALTVGIVAIGLVMISFLPRMQLRTGL